MAHKDGAINREGASDLWLHAQDGDIITATEVRTFRYILSRKKIFPITSDARAYLEGLLKGHEPARKRKRAQKAMPEWYDEALERTRLENVDNQFVIHPGSATARSPYRTIAGIAYDRHLINHARVLTWYRRDKRQNYLKKSDAKMIWATAMEDGKLTDVETRTLKYILSNEQSKLVLSTQASDYLEARLKGDPDPVQQMQEQEKVHAANMKALQKDHQRKLKQQRKKAERKARAAEIALHDQKQRDDKMEAVLEEQHRLALGAQRKAHGGELQDAVQAIERQAAAHK